ncbi:MAG: molybdopterin-binding protein [Candidatus Bathyarchaeia archaeon]|nr:competence damage-inducible protein A [Candidatus Bathyarchaeota archaeon]
MNCKVEIICIGNELLTGKTLNTNAHWLSERITRIGGEVERIITVGDRLNTIADVLRESLRRKPNLVITCGGLGPTYDDKTLEAFSKAFRRPLKINKEALRMVKSRYEKILGKERLELTQPRMKMATLPSGSKPVENPVGTAPAVSLTEKGVKFIILPGVPEELKAIFEESIAGKLRGMVGRVYLHEETLPVSGFLESQIAPLLDIVVNKYPDVYVKSHVRVGEGRRGGSIELHFSSRSSSARNAKRKVSEAVNLMSKLLKGEPARKDRGLGKPSKC